MPLLKNCTFREHNASIGGAILISDGSNINLNEIVFVRNTANKGGAIYALESNVWIYGPTLFNSNHGAEGGGIFCQMCTLSGLGEIKFLHNFASRTGGAIALILANATFYNITTTEKRTSILLYKSNMTFLGNTDMQDHLVEH